MIKKSSSLGWGQYKAFDVSYEEEPILKRPFSSQQIRKRYLLFDLAPHQNYIVIKFNFKKVYRR
jgi:hypothetical protein